MLLNRETGESQDRNALNLRTGDEVILCLENDEIHLSTVKTAIRRAQDTVRRYVPENRSLSEELVADRRREAESE